MRTAAAESFDFSKTMCTIFERGTVKVFRGDVQLSEVEAKQYLAEQNAKSEAAEKARIAAKGHDCFENQTFHDDEFRRGRRVSKHHWTCGLCGDLLQVG